MSSCALQSQQIHSSQDPGRPETIPFRMFVVQWCTRLHPWTCDRIGSTELWNSRKQLSRQTRMQRLVTTVEATFAFLSCLYPQKRVSYEILYSPNLGRKQQRCLVSVKRLKKISMAKISHIKGKENGNTCKEVSSVYTSMSMSQLEFVSLQVQLIQ